MFPNPVNPVPSKTETAPFLSIATGPTGTCRSVHAMNPCGKPVIYRSHCLKCLGRFRVCRLLTSTRHEAWMGSPHLHLCLWVWVSQGLIWKRAQNGLKSQNISGEASLDIALYFRQVQGRPLALEFRSCASRPSLRWGTRSCHPKLGMSRVGSRASEGSEICTLFDQAPKCQFFFLFKKKICFMYIIEKKIYIFNQLHVNEAIEF